MLQTYHYTDSPATANPIGASNSLLGMSTNRETALALAGNLKRLMDHNELSQAQLARKAKVGQSTLSGILDTASPLEINPRSETIEKLAAYFGIPAWQLLIPELPLDLLLSKQLTKLIENYRDAPAEGRASVDRVAEGEIRYAIAAGGHAPKNGTNGVL